MIDLIIVDKENIDCFAPMISNETLAFIEISYEDGNENNLLMYGVLDDDDPVGVIVGAIDPGKYLVTIEHIFVKKDYRRQGIATNLVILVGDAISLLDDNFKLECKVTEFFKYKDDSGSSEVVTDGGADLRGFFNFLEFTEEKIEDIGAYQMHLADGDNRKVPPVPPSYNIKKPSELTKRERDSLNSNENGMILQYLNNGYLDDELSQFYVSDNEVKSFLAIKSDEKMCSIVWASIKNGSQIPAILVGRNAFLTARKIRSGNTIVYMPYINEVSREMIEKICNDKIVPAEINYKYSFNLSDVM